MNKYNKIMSRVTVDPEMKSRVMSAVSAAIREQSAGGAVVTDIPVTENNRPARKKARKTPIAIISSIAAAVVLILGVVLVFRSMSSSSFEHVAMSTTANGNHNKGVLEAAGEIDNHVSYDTESTTAYYEDACETTAETEAEYNIDNRNYATSSNSIDGLTGDEKTITIRQPDATTGGDTQGMGDVRLDRINKALPFDLKGFGSGTYSADITYELFLGEGGEKIVLFEAPEGTDILKEIEPSNKSNITESVTPSGIPVRLCLVSFANVTASETSPYVNAAIYSKDGKAYLLVFSDTQPVDVINSAVDAM